MATPGHLPRFSQASISDLPVSHQSAGNPFGVSKSPGRSPGKYLRNSS
jgi:hypothetical protein